MTSDKRDDLVRTLVGMLAGEKGVWIIQPQTRFNDESLTQQLRELYPKIWGPAGTDRFQFMRRDKKGSWIMVWVEE